MYGFIITCHYRRDTTIEICLWTGHQDLVVSLRVHGRCMQPTWCIATWRYLAAAHASHGVFLFNHTGTWQKHAGNGGKPQVELDRKRQVVEDIKFDWEIITKRWQYIYIWHLYKWESMNRTIEFQILADWGLDQQNPYATRQGLMTSD